VVPADAALKIVGLLRTRRKERRVAGADRLTIEEVVAKVLLDEHADGIGEAVEAIGRAGATRAGEVELNRVSGQPVVAVRWKRCSEGGGGAVGGGSKGDRTGPPGQVVAAYGGHSAKDAGPSWSQAS
jgi:hypothetical protein